MVNHLITIILLIIAFYSKGKMDKSADGKFEDKYKNNDKSWGNKYFNPLSRYQKKWYYPYLTSFKQIFIYINHLKLTIHHYYERLL